MKTNKSMYFFAAALMASTMGMTTTSCSNEDIVENVAPTATTKLALGISVLNGNGVSTKASAADVNLGGAVANIANVTVVPMINDQVQNPIDLETYINGTTTSYYKEAAVLQTVDRFRVYGNLSAKCNENAKFVMPSTVTDAWVDAGLTSFSKPHPLYYFVDTDNAGGYFAATSESSWESILAWGDKTTAAIGTNNRIKISGVTYAVGTLAAAVKDGIKNSTEEIFFDGDTYAEATTKYSWSDIKENGGTINIVGITIDGQTKEFDESFNKKGTEEVVVYDKAATETLASASISFNANKIDGANIYCVVADEDASSVTANFRFQNNSGHKLYLRNNEVVENGGYFYLAIPLTQGANNQKIFEKGKTTIINATVTDWGKGTTTPTESTDVQIGIEISVDWVAGMYYEQEI